MILPIQHSHIGPPDYCDYLGIHKAFTAVYVSATSLQNIHIITGARKPTVAWQLAANPTQPALGKYKQALVPLLTEVLYDYKNFPPLHCQSQPLVGRLMQPTQRLS